MAAMNEARLLLRFFDRTFITKVMILALLYSLLPLAEIFLLIYVGARIGNYFTLALSALTGLVGMLVALRGFHKNLTTLKQKIREGIYPEQEFITLVGIFLAAVLLLTPGFITDVLGCFLFFIPAMRNGFGRVFVRLTGTDLKELYEYLKLYD
jgi:UPF0716 protein FxsA